MSSTELCRALNEQCTTWSQGGGKGEKQLKNDGCSTPSLAIANINAQLGSTLGQFWSHLLGPGVFVAPKVGPMYL